MFREDDQQFVMPPDCLLDLFIELFPTLNIFWCVPASDTFALEDIVEPCGERFILVRITDEA